MTRRQSNRKNARQSTEEDGTEPRRLGRRRFVRAAGVVATTAILAGCPTSGTGSDAPSVIEGGEADVTTMVVRDTPRTQRPFEDSVEPVVSDGSSVLVLGSLIFQRAGPRGLVVAGDATNTGDRPFEAVAVRVTLYNAGASEDGLTASPSIRLENRGLGTGESWQWAATFEEEFDFQIDYFSVEAVANFD